MEAIDANDIANAMRETIEGAGRSIEADALSLAADEAGGFAFLIQLIGYHLWRVDPNAPVITLEDARSAVSFAERDMERMVLEPTVRNLTARELEYLRAMAKDPSVSAVRDIAKRMGVGANNASKVRKRLVERGLIGTRGRGRVGFDMPMLKEYLLSLD